MLVTGEAVERENEKVLAVVGAAVLLILALSGVGTALNTASGEDDDA